MIVFRLCRALYKDDINGVGASIAGGRWNSKGTKLLYTCENRALCTAEIAVHTPLGIFPNNYYLQTISIPDCKTSTIDSHRLPGSWRNFPHEMFTKTIGDHFVQQNNQLVLKVPSAIVQDEYNYLINPSHKLFQKIKIIRLDSFKFDRRMFE